MHSPWRRTRAGRACPASTSFALTALGPVLSLSKDRSPALPYPPSRRHYSTCLPIFMPTFFTFPGGRLSTRSSHFSNHPYHLLTPPSHAISPPTLRDFFQAQSVIFSRHSASLFLVHFCREWVVHLRARIDTRPSPPCRRSRRAGCRACQIRAAAIPDCSTWPTLTLPFLSLSTH